MARPSVKKHRAVMMADAEMPPADDEDEAELPDLVPVQVPEEIEASEPPIDEDDDAAPREVAEKNSGTTARTVRQPVAPAEEAQLRHVTAGHVPFAPWCKHCVKGRAKDDPHRRQTPRESVRPVIEMDYMFLTEGQDTLTVAVLVDKASGSIGATAVNHKGAEKSGIDYAAAWLETFG